VWGLSPLRKPLKICISESNLHKTVEKITMANCVILGVRELIVILCAQPRDGGGLGTVRVDYIGFVFQSPTCTKHSKRIK
jgi:hypothetical protein